MPADDAASFFSSLQGRDDDESSNVASDLEYGRDLSSSKIIQVLDKNQFVCIMP